jgi:hypothetical protein
VSLRPHPLAPVTTAGGASSSGGPNPLRAALPGPSPGAWRPWQNPSPPQRDHSGWRLVPVRPAGLCRAPRPALHHGAARQSLFPVCEAAAVLEPVRDELVIIGAEAIQVALDGQDVALTPTRDIDAGIDSTAVDRVVGQLEASGLTPSDVPHERSFTWPSRLTCGPEPSRA